MATITREISVDVAQLNRFAAIVAKQYDKQSRFLKVTLLNNGEEMSVDSASTAVINAKREDGESKTFEGTVNGDGTVTVPITYWMLQLDGVVECDISIITASTTVLTTTLFELNVQYSASPDDSEIEGDDDYGVLIQLIADVQGIKDTEAKRVTAENSRASAESKRVSAETARVTAENSRVTTEKNRVTAESGRVTAENARVEAEKKRASAETTRISAETARVAAETARESASKTAVENCETATDAALKAVSTITITDSDTGKIYQGELKVVNGKPVFEYDEVSV